MMVFPQVSRTLVIVAIAIIASARALPTTPDDVVPEVTSRSRKILRFGQGRVERHTYHSALIVNLTDKMLS